MTLSPLRPGVLPLVLVAALAAPVAARAQDKAAPVLTHTPVAQGFKGDPLVVTATITDESGVFAPTVHYRPVGSKTYVDVIMSAQQGSTYVAQLPPAPGDLEYWIEVFDDAGNGPSRAGAEDKPFRVAFVAKPAPAPAPAAAVTPAPEPVVAAPKPATKLSEIEDLPLPGVQELTAIPVKADDVAKADAVPEAALEGLDDLAEAQDPFFTKWWFWAGAGGAAAVATTLLVVALQPPPIYVNQMGSVVVSRP